MYLLDTNVVSELRKIAPGRANPNVRAWAARTDGNALHLSVVTILELEMGILLLERRDQAQSAHLRHWLWDSVVPSFRERILEITIPVARRAAGLHVPNRRPANDALIAATAAVHNMSLVTRNVTDFASDIVHIINPWEAPSG